VLNISSMAGENKNVRMASYASSKAAVNHLTRNIARRSRPPRHPRELHRAGRDQDRATVIARVRRRCSSTPLGRLGEADDIAYAALFLRSPAASWVSGDADGERRRRPGTRLSTAASTPNRRTTMAAFDASGVSHGRPHRHRDRRRLQNIGEACPHLAGAGRGS
jgi:hypothetical protein